jgi:hypothetical protein
MVSSGFAGSEEWPAGFSKRITADSPVAVKETTCEFFVNY